MQIRAARWIRPASCSDADPTSKMDPSSKVAKVIKNDKKQASNRVPKGPLRHHEWKKESDITKAELDEYRKHLDQAALSTNNEQGIADGCNKLEEQPDGQ